jgi:polyisoprenoid-binding protein YceI
MVKVRYRMKEQAGLGRGCASHTVRAAVVFGAIAFVLMANIGATGQSLTFRIDPAHTTINFTLGDVLHTVHGTFRLARGTLEFNPATNKLTGEIVADAKSGETGSTMRDRKMHGEVLESGRYPEIAFRPDHIEGPVSLQGKSTVQVHGVFAIHGSDHELIVPADIEMSADRWSAVLHFAIPYEKWGMKNPSTLFLRVSDSVQIDLSASGTIIRH